MTDTTQTDTTPPAPVENTWPNPLIAGFYPDPSVVKVGTDYYLANSTFEYLPGIPIFHSTDLVSWTQIGHVVERPGQLASAHVPTLGGAWAPTIRHRDGIFYVVVTDAMGRGMLIFSTTDPAGPWSDGTLIEGIHGIDTDLAWDEDGLAYITYSGLDVTSGELPTGHKGILQFTVDLATGVPLSQPVSVWSGTGLKFPEAPHLYQHGGYWYLMIAEGGTERGHGISVARGARPYGPFTEGAAAGGPANPILSARSTDRPIQNTGHGDLVETPDGGWAIVMLGMRPTGMTQAFSALGRETFITSARWEDGWLAADPVLLNPRAGETVFADDFTGPALAPEWIAVRRYPAEVSTLAVASAEAAGGRTTPGRLVLVGEGGTLDAEQPILVGVRQRNPWSSTSVRVGGVAGSGAGLGGLGVRYDEEHHYEIEVGNGVVTARACVAGIRQEWTVPLDPAQIVDGAVTLGLDTVPPDASSMISGLTSDIVVLSVGAGDDRVELARVDGRYLSQETAASFTGRVLCLYAVTGKVTFSAFRYTGRE
ncbi:glycoside hydrolase family 43 protein [Cryobacterium arcticum]|uniref:Glycoside hydrolase 43 family protein n=1 Tax=Cryobacterium arcticum TaxID=670052 RepID=A0A317ZUC7_9MICO|nr:glycoside hydrolase family 43 protein [Cryobacterium arcticum]PXA70056.1 glycoside hydrolase 43 family protein [Cryobacterium arcticum]